MEIFYHLSHFLEILTGIYFGGFALFGFMQKGSAKNLYSRLKDKSDRAVYAKICADEYYLLTIETIKKNGGINLVFQSIKWFFVGQFTKYSNKVFRFSSSKIDEIGPEEENTIIVKKYFPSFFFTGCFSFILVLCSAFEFGVKGSPRCINCINNFLVFYMYSAILFHIWSLFIFPLFVNKKEYLNLISVNLVIAIVLLVLTVVFSLHNPFIISTAWLLSEANRSWLICFVLLVLIFPLMFILIKFVAILIAWQMSIFSTNTIINVFGNNKTDLENEITLMEN